MSQYKEARERTKTKIEDAYWDLMMNNERITVKKIIEKAGIHKSTFYFYYEWVDDVLAEIKTRMMNLLVSTIESKNRNQGNFQQVMIEMRKMFQENRKYLIPLVLEQRGGAFAVNYREFIKERFAEDIGLDYKTGNDVKNDVANCVLAGLVEIMLYELSSEIIPDEFTYKIGNILSNDNLNNAYKKVKSNKGTGGVDGMNVDELLSFLKDNGKQLKQQLLEGKYKPNPVRRVEIPKETKGEFRKLGVPTVVDRVFQQAITQVLSPVYEEQFSENSFGFRPGRGAHNALKQCRTNVNDGYEYVVDMDLEKFFDTVCQSKLVEVLSRTIKDGRVISYYRLRLTTRNSGNLDTQHSQSFI